MPLPGLLASLCGVEVQEYDSLLSGDHRAVKFERPEFGTAGKATIWCDILKPTTAEVFARYDEDFYAGEPLVTQNHVGAGSAIYVGTVGDPAFVEAIVGYAARQAGVAGLMQTPLGVEVTARWHGDERLLFVLEPHRYSTADHT